MSKLESPTAI